MCPGLLPPNLYEARIMNVPTTIPLIALRAWPSLVGAKFIERVTTPVPANPDTIFDIYETKTGQLLTFVRTDYADPRDEIAEFHTVSRRYRAGDLLKPHNETMTITVQEHDEMEGDFFITDESAAYFKVYYYVAKTVQ